MNPNWEKFLKETYEKEGRFFHVNDTYATKTLIAVTGKFYARHEAFDPSTADPVILEAIKLYFDKCPKDKYEWPVTSNQCYGWFSKPLVHMDRNDERFYFPAKYDPNTNQEIKIKRDKTMVIPKFTGVPWKF